MQSQTKDSGEFSGVFSGHRPSRHSRHSRHSTSFQVTRAIRVRPARREPVGNQVYQDSLAVLAKPDVPAETSMDRLANRARKAFPVCSACPESPVWTAPPARKDARASAPITSRACLEHRGCWVLWDPKATLVYRGAPAAMACPVLVATTAPSARTACQENQARWATLGCRVSSG